MVAARVPVASSVATTNTMNLTRLARVLIGPPGSCRSEEGATVPRPARTNVVGWWSSLAHHRSTQHGAGEQGGDRGGAAGALRAQQGGDEGLLLLGAGEPGVGVRYAGAPGPGEHG